MSLKSKDINEIIEIGNAVIERLTTVPETPEQPPEPDGYYVVEFFESEQGWGSETWYRGFSTEQEARQKADEVNAKNTASTAPVWYMIATYQGFMKKVPEGYKR